MSLLLFGATLARADTSVLDAGKNPPVEVGALHCDGVRHEWTVDVPPGERWLIWRGDRACEGAEAWTPSEQKRTKNESEYDRAGGVLRLRVINRSDKPKRVRVSTFGAYA